MSKPGEIATMEAGEQTMCRLTTAKSRGPPSHVDAKLRFIATTWYPFASTGSLRVDRYDAVTCLPRNNHIHHIPYSPYSRERCPTQR